MKVSRHNTAQCCSTVLYRIARYTSMLGSAMPSTVTFRIMKVVHCAHATSSILLVLFSSLCVRRQRHDEASQDHAQHLGPPPKPWGKGPLGSLAARGGHPPQPDSRPDTAGGTPLPLWSERDHSQQALQGGPGLPVPSDPCGEPRDGPSRDDPSRDVRAVTLSNLWAKPSQRCSKATDLPAVPAALFITE